jgi:FixJ family two-component response regulator
MSTAAFPVHPVLLVDDDKDLLRNYVYTLRADGITNVITCEDGADVDALMKEHEFDAVLLDLNMPRLSGRDVLPRIVQRCPDVPVIVVTGVDEVDTAVKCMRAGAFDYMVKPVKAEHLLTGLRRALDVRDVRRENALLTQHLLSTDWTSSRSIQMLTAGGALDRAFEADGHGLFTRYILNYFHRSGGRDSGVSALKLAAYVRNRVKRETSGWQTPHFGRMGAGEIVIAMNDPAAPALAMAN